mmetsp:Transcript_3218/g.12898  ORF Transcript_3218/g.12898 Transcript_3218/m.12898 type:complete len:329 (-) Transcript_3218:8-994(-)
MPHVTVNVAAGSDLQVGLVLDIRHVIERLRPLRVGEGVLHRVHRQEGNGDLPQPPSREAQGGGEELLGDAGPDGVGVRQGVVVQLFLRVRVVLVDRCSSNGQRRRGRRHQACKGGEVAILDAARDVLLLHQVQAEHGGHQHHAPVHAGAPQRHERGRAASHGQAGHKHRQVHEAGAGRDHLAQVVGGLSRQILVVLEVRAETSRALGAPVTLMVQEQHQEALVYQAAQQTALVHLVDLSRTRRQEPLELGVCGVAMAQIDHSARVAAALLQLKSLQPETHVVHRHADVHLDVLWHLGERHLHIGERGIDVRHGVQKAREGGKIGVRRV